MSEESYEDLKSAADKASAEHSQFKKSLGFVPSDEEKAKLKGFATVAKRLRERQYAHPAHKKSAVEGGLVEATTGAPTGATRGRPRVDDTRSVTERTAADTSGIEGKSQAELAAMFQATPRGGRKEAIRAQYHTTGANEGYDLDSPGICTTGGCENIIPVEMQMSTDDSCPSCARRERTQAPPAPGMRRNERGETVKAEAPEPRAAAPATPTAAKNENPANYVMKEID